jgi:hypothetical protein
MTLELSGPIDTLQTRLFGFDKDEVRACLRNLVSDCDEARRQVERLTVELAAAGEVRRSFPSETVGVQVERVLASAHRVAEEVKAEAEQSAKQLLREAHDEAMQVRSRAEADASALTRSASVRVSELERDIQQLTERRLAVLTLLDETADRMAAFAEELKRSKVTADSSERTLFSVPADADKSRSHL